MRGRSNRTPEKLAAFHEQLAATGNVTAAAEAAGIPRTCIYDWRAEDPEFAAAMDASAQRGLDRAEDELARRGIQGWDEPVYQQGHMVGSVRRFSDTCLIFLLKNRRRDIYGDRQQVDVNAVGDLGAAMAAARARVKEGT